MRLFTGLDLPGDVVQRVETLMAELCPLAELKLSPLANLHITTKFIGSWPTERLNELDEALEPVTQRQAPFIELGDLAWFSDALVATVNSHPSLLQLAADTDEALLGLGVEKEIRAYSPHLTLARAKGGGALEKLEATNLGSFTASGFYLYSSEQGLYKKIREYWFD